MVHAFPRTVAQNEPTVTALLERNPFPDKPPVYVRAQFYDYAFAGSQEKAWANGGTGDCSDCISLSWR